MRFALSFKPRPRESLLEGEVTRHLRRMAVPLMWGFFAMNSFSVVDALYISRLGTKALAAFGFTPTVIARLFLIEGAVLTLAGAVVGTAGAVGFTALMMAALGTFWIGAVGTTSLHLHVTPWPLAAGALGGALAGLACVVWTLRGLRRELYAGE